MCANLSYGNTVGRNQKAAYVEGVVGNILLSAVKTFCLTIKFITQHTIYWARNTHIFFCFVKSAVRHAKACLIDWIQAES